MSFWDLSDGDTAKTTQTSYEVPTGGDVIPDKSTVLAMIDKAAWKEAYQSSENFIELTWTVMEPEQFANRKVFQKLWVADLDPNTKDKTKAIAKRDKARQMLATIDANCGGKLQATGEAPTDEGLAIALTNKKPLLIKVMEWEMNGNKGNWVAMVAPKGSGEVKVGIPLLSTGSGSTTSAQAQSDLDMDSISF